MACSRAKVGATSSTLAATKPPVSAVPPIRHCTPTPLPAAAGAGACLGAASSICAVPQGTRVAVAPQAYRCTPHGALQPVVSAASAYPSSHDGRSGAAAAAKALGRTAGTKVPSKGRKETVLIMSGGGSRGGSDSGGVIVAGGKLSGALHFGNEQGIMRANSRPCCSVQ